MISSLKNDGLVPIEGNLNPVEVTKQNAQKTAQDHQSDFGDFSQIFGKMIDQVNDHQVKSDQAIKEIISGKTKNIHEAMLAIERADTSLKLMMQVRNKVLEAYREVMRMQV